jgi:hypothetical protein
MADAMSDLMISAATTGTGLPAANAAVSMRRDSLVIAGTLGCAVARESIRPDVLANSPSTLRAKLRANRRRVPLLQ